MKRKVFLTVLALSIITTLFLGSALTIYAEKKGKPIVVGAPVPRASAYGQNGERGLIMAVEEVNAAGGANVNGKMRPIQLEIIDSRDEEPGVPTSEVLLAIEKLILQNFFPKIL